MALPSLLLHAPLCNAALCEDELCRNEQESNGKNALWLGEQGKKPGSVVASRSVHCRNVPLLTFQMKLDLCIAEKISSSSVALQASSGSQRTSTCPDFHLCYRKWLGSWYCWWYSLLKKAAAGSELGSPLLQFLILNSVFLIQYSCYYSSPLSKGRESRGKHLNFAVSTWKADVISKDFYYNFIFSSGVTSLPRQKQEKLSLRWDSLTLATFYLKYWVSYTFQAKNQRNVEHSYSSNLFTTLAVFIKLKDNNCSKCLKRHMESILKKNMFKRDPELHYVPMD